MAVAQPNWLDVGKGFIPTSQLFTNPDMLYIAIGILGATVMPHNLYLHSAIIQTRAWTRCPQGRKAAIKYGTLDSSFSLLFAFLINASILILAGAAFYYGTSGEHRCVLRVVIPESSQHKRVELVHKGQKTCRAASCWRV
jgi:manganese transport protein